MATFVALAKKIRVNFDAPVDKAQLLRDAENDFIEKTLCTETYTSQSVGTSTNLVDFPSGCIRIHRLTWDGTRLEPLPQGTRYSVYDTDSEPYTGTPAYYWIQNDDIMLIPQPGASGYLGIWYTAYNTDTDATSPDIPTIEQEKIIPLATARLLELDGNDNRADRFLGEYQRLVTRTKIKYYNQRFAQGGVLYEQPSGFTNTDRYGVATVPNEDEYIWKKVQISGHDEYPPTEQTFTTGTSPLTAALLDSPQNRLPTFRDANTHVIEITTAYQDRTCFLSTEPTVSSSNVTFGLTLSEAGLETASYYDIKLIVSQ